MRTRPFSMSLALITTTVAAGLTIRFAHLGLPAPVIKYGGSALWAMMLYWVCSTALPSWRPVSGVLLSGIVGTSVEFLKLYHVGWLDAFRRTLAGILLLGRIFNPWDIAVYWTAISLAAAADAGLRRSGTAQK